MFYDVKMFTILYLSEKVRHETVYNMALIMWKKQRTLKKKKRLVVLTIP